MPAFRVIDKEMPMDPRPDPLSTNPAARTIPESPSWPRLPRLLAAGRGASWWSEGWNVFMAAPLLWIGVTVVFAIMIIAMNFVPLIGNIAASLLTPVFAAGLLLGCHALAQGRPLRFDHLFAGFREGRIGPLVLLGLFAFLAGLALAFVLMTMVFGAMGLSGLTAIMRGDPSLVVERAAAGMGIAALLAIPVAFVGYGLFVMGWFFAPALCALNRVDALAAITASFDASWKNLGAVVVFVLIFFALAIVATIPFGIGWLVLGPVTIGAAYAGWREVFSE